MNSYLLDLFIGGKTMLERSNHKSYYQRLKSGEVIARGTKPPRNILGMKFGHLTATRFSHRAGFLKRPYWEFTCECGIVKVLAAGDIIQGKTISCGCVKPSGRPATLQVGEAAFNNLLHSYKAGANFRDLEFSLTTEEFKVLTKESCKYCGVEPVQIWTGTSKKCSPYVYNGVDRVNNSVGYIANNVVPCCGVCNLAKRSLTLEQFMEWIARLVKFQNLKETVANQSEEK